MPKASCGNHAQLAVGGSLYTTCAPQLNRLAMIEVRGPSCTQAVIVLMDELSVHTSWGMSLHLSLESRK